MNPDKLWHRFLAEYLKQLRRKIKADIFNELDEKIIQHTDDKKLEAAVFESAYLQMILLEKIDVISHTLEVDSPHERIVLELAAVDAHKDAENDSSLQFYSKVHSRNSPTLTHVQEDLQTLQESHTDHVHTNAPHDSTQWTDSPTTQNLSLLL